MKPPFPDDEPRRFDDDDDDEQGRARFSLTAGTLGLLLVLLSLSVFFLAAMAGYIVVRVTNVHSPAWGQMSFPAGLWVSTLVLVASGVTMHQAQRAARDRVAGHVRLYLCATVVLGLVFLAIQAPALRSLLAVHYASLEDNVAVYGLSVVLIALHALHVLGGFIPLTGLTWRAMRQTSPMPTAGSIRLMATYWHFLHIVWVVMFVVFRVLA